jgi:hypothetical protein
MKLQAYFQLNSEKKTFYTFVNLLKNLKQKIAVKQQNTSIQNEKQLFSQSLYSRNAHNVKNRP